MRVRKVERGWLRKEETETEWLLLFKSKSTEELEREASLMSFQTCSMEEEEEEEEWGQQSHGDEAIAFSLTLKRTKYLCRFGWPRGHASPPSSFFSTFANDKGISTFRVDKEVPGSCPHTN